MGLDDQRESSASCSCDWLNGLAPEHARQIFGDQWQRIAYETHRAFKSKVAGSGANHESEPLERGKYGLNQKAVGLFIDSWKEIEWRKNEGQPSADDSQVIRISDFEGALNPTSSRRWTQALTRAGYRSSDEQLTAVWNDAFAVGFDVGGHHAAFLAAASAGELAQFAQDDCHFFLSLMPWIRRGHWPCGWDDQVDKLKVF